MALVEVVAPPLADPAVVARAVAIVTAWGKTPGRLCRPPGLHRQPGQPAVHDRGPADPRGRRGQRHRDRRGDARRRLPDGPVRAHGPHRHRCHARGRDGHLGGPRASGPAPAVADPGSAWSRPATSAARPARASTDTRTGSGSARPMRPPTSASDEQLVPTQIRGPDPRRDRRPRRGSPPTRASRPPTSSTSPCVSAPGTRMALSSLDGRHLDGSTSLTARLRWAAMKARSMPSTVLATVFVVTACTFEPGVPRRYRLPRRRRTRPSRPGEPVAPTYRDAHAAADRDGSPTRPPRPRHSPSPASRHRFAEAPGTPMSTRSSRRYLPT